MSLDTEAIEARWQHRGGWTNRDPDVRALIDEVKRLRKVVTAQRSPYLNDPTLGAANRKVEGEAW